MENTCKISYLWDWENYLTSINYLHKQILSKPFVILINIFSLLFAALSIFVIIVAQKDAGLYVSGISFISFATYWILLRRKIGIWVYKRKFNKNTSANKICEWVFDDKGYVFHCEEQIKIEAAWKLYSNVVETPEGFLFRVGGNVFYWLPFDKFDTEDGPEIFRILAKKNNLTFRQIH